MEVMAMGRRAIWRAWYGKRLGIQQAFEDISSLESAANFAAFIAADRLEVLSETDPLTAAESAT